MNMRKCPLFTLLLMAVFVGLLSVSWAAAKEEKEQPAQEQKKLPEAPDFQLKNLEGERVALSDLLGKGPVLISFWATWCKPCIKELPHLQELHDKYKEDGLSVVAISEDAPRSVSKVKSFIAGNRYGFLVLLDDNYSTQRKFNFRGLPYSVLLDKEGHIIYKRMGYRPGDELVLAEKIAPLIEVEEEEEGMTEEEEGAEEAGQDQSAGEKQGDEGAKEEKDAGKKDVKKEWAKTKSAEERDE